jgi:hypothetical protein
VNDTDTYFRRRPLSHQLVDVAHRHHPDGYTIRLAATHPVDHTV